MTQRPHSQAGFTLVEALIAAAVLAMISILLAPALLGAINAASRSHDLTARIEDRAALEGVVHELFASVQAPSSTDAAARFSGNARSASLLVRPGGGAPQRARLDIAGQSLTLTLEPLDQARQSQQVRSVTATLAEGFESGVLSYVGIGDTGWRPVDQTSWSADHPPRLVIVRLNWPDGTRTRIQALVSGQGQFDCRFDSGRGLCLGDIY